MKICTFILSAVLFATVLVPFGTASAQEPPEPEASADDAEASEAKSVEPEASAGDAEASEAKSVEPEASADDAGTSEAKSVEPEASAGDAEAAELAGQELEVITDPEGADVSLGGSSPEFQQTLGRTPLRVPMEPGHLTLVVELDGYQTATAEIDVEKGKTAVMQLRLEKETVRTRFGFRLAGHLLFWPGLATAGTGIALIAVHESDDSKNTGTAGFVTAGIGVAMTAVGGVILGLTSRNRDPYVMPVAFMGAPDGRGAGIMYRKTF